jgi:hypothetical protein
MTRVKIVVRVTADPPNIAFALQYEYRPKDMWIERSAEKCQECYRLRYRYLNAL